MTYVTEPMNRLSIIVTYSESRKVAARFVGPQVSLCPGCHFRKVYSCKPRKVPLATSALCGAADWDIAIAEREGAEEETVAGEDTEEHAACARYRCRVVQRHCHGHH